ncbi:eukaryotic translation initiation factor 5B-like [Helianthus annuus]|uniref:eukaryotic translation initiation factor 5B-like n=1 Tax=Helianthus annuus TaxID=4232 RepID=UPI000B908D17|nr:eukaryotic translation initiation factor 5B-like [Helianthus annuus]
MGYVGALNVGNYLKSKFPKPYKFIIHSVLMALSHTKGGYDTMRDYQMNMVTALVLNKKYNFSHIVFHYMAENITTKSRTWSYPIFVQMLIDHVYPDIERDFKNDLLVQSHMSNDSLKQLARYHPNHPEPKIVAEFFGYIKDVNYVDPDLVNHQNWRNEEEMKEAAYVDELKTLEEFKTTRNDWFVKETRRRGKKPKKKQKKVAKTLLIDEPEVEEPVVTAEEDPYADIDQVMLNVDDLVSEQAANVEAEKRRIQEATEKEKQLRKRKREEKDDAAYIPSPEHVSESQSPSSGKKKAGARKRIGLHIPPYNLEDIGDFGFANDEQVKKLEKKMDDVLNENKIVAAESKKVADREKILEMHVKRLESDNKALLKKIDTDQTEIDFLKVRVAELEEEKARRDEQNKYFEMKNKELEAAKALKEHEFYMLNKVVENMLGTSIEQRFEEIQVEELRAKRQAEIDEQMKDKGKGAESSVAVAESSIVPSLVIENPVPISSVSTIFEEHEDDDDEKVFSASSHGSDNDDDDAQGGMGIKVTEQSSERTVDDFLNDTVNVETGGAEGKGELKERGSMVMIRMLIKLRS